MILILIVLLVSSNWAEYLDCYNCSQYGRKKESMFCDDPFRPQGKKNYNITCEEDETCGKLTERSQGRKFITRMCVKTNFCEDENWMNYREWLHVFSSCDTCDEYLCNKFPRMASKGLTLISFAISLQMALMIFTKH